MVAACHGVGEFAVVHHWVVREVAGGQDACGKEYLLVDDLVVRADPVLKFGGGDLTIGVKAVTVLGLEVRVY